MKMTLFLLLTTLGACEMVRTKLLSEPGNGAETYCSFDLFAMKGIPCSAQYTGDGPTVAVLKNGNDLQIQITKGNNVLAATDIWKDKRGNLYSQKTFEEEEGNTQIVVTTYFSDSMIYRIVKNTDVLNANDTYWIRKIYKNKIDSYDFLEGFKPDSTKIFNRAYLRENAFSYKGTKLRVVANEFLMDSHIETDSEFKQYDTNHKLTAQERNLSKENIRSTTDGIFWYLFYQEIDVQGN